MSVIVSEKFAQKAKELTPSLHHTKVLPQKTVNIVFDDAAYQGFRVVDAETASFPMELRSGERVILDFGAHNVGYLHFSVNHFGAVKITDAPVMLSFSFGEFPLEIMASKENYHGTLGSGWLQNETKSMVFTPYIGALERRYAFRYLKIERVDTASFPIAIDNLYVDGVSSVSMEEVPPFHIPDKALEQIYKMSLCTLKECSQEVFEDGPKRDRRLWLGDLRLQALSDYVSFKNTALVKRCLYLFAAYRRSDGFVAPCVFPDSSPYIDAKGWHLSDYSLFFSSCLYDYMLYQKDLSLVEELYDTAVLQVQLVMKRMEADGTIKGSDVFIDWCEGLDKSVAFLGVYLYCLHHLRTIAESLGKDSAWMVAEIKEKKKILLSYRNKDGFFVTKSGQLSWHSQIWSALSGCLSREESLLLLQKTKEENPKVHIHTPYMMHFYIEALYTMGEKDEAMDVIRGFWGELSSVGFDCCPEIFNPENPMESPYNAPEINSACHAWSCTPIYWIYRYYHEI